MVAHDVAQIDALLSEQVNAILHHPKFQRLEASWRGLRWLVDQGDPDDKSIQIRVLNVTWRELERDLERAGEFDQSQLFRKVYNAEFDAPGGTPYGLLLGDYEIRHGLSPEGINDLRVLERISEVAAAAWAPFVAAADPALLGLSSFADLQYPVNLPRTFEQLEYLKWRAFRETPDARFVGLVLPRVLRRLPYEDDGSRRDGFRFREDVSGPDPSKYLWGTAVYAFGAVVLRSFAESGWLAGIRGVQQGVEGGGLVVGLPAHSFATDKRGVVAKSSTDVLIHDRQEPELSDLGFIPLCQCQDVPYAAFYACHSVQKPKKYDELSATLNAKVSALLQYMLCASRFAHYLKVMMRDKVGSFSDPEKCEDFLHRWIHQYVTADSEASPEVKARLPLREAKIKIREHPSNPGNYLCIAHLWPHYELDELTTTLRVTTDVKR
jgi:type VI secretion system ImpC/EvpB family protein